MTVNNLYVTYDDGGQPHFHINDAEVTKDEWMLRHPMMKEDNANGRNSDSGQLGRLGGSGAVPADDADLKERQRQGVREYRAKVKAEGDQGRPEGGTGGTGAGEDAVG